MHRFVYKVPMSNSVGHQQETVYKLAKLRLPKAVASSVQQHDERRPEDISYFKPTHYVPGQIFRIQHSQWCHMGVMLLFLVRFNQDFDSYTLNRFPFVSQGGGLSFINIDRYEVNVHKFLSRWANKLSIQNDPSIFESTKRVVSDTKKTKNLLDRWHRKSYYQDSWNFM